MPEAFERPFDSRVSGALQRLKYLAFEINDLCPLTGVHKECPRNADPPRWAEHSQEHPIDNDLIESYLGFALEYGFDGMVNLHYYNEPMATPHRIIDLMDRLDAKWSIWTNGVCVDRAKEIFSRCADVMITIYPETKVGSLQDLGILEMPNVRVQRANLDGRIREDIEPRWHPRITRCNRLDWELIIDYYGNGHICCGDWRAEIWIGNANLLAPETFFDSWVWQKEKLDRMLTNITKESFDTIPHVCQLCLTRSPWISQV